PQDRSTRRTESMRDPDDLRLRLDRARASHEDDLVPTDPGAILELDHRRLRPPLAGDLLVRLGDMDHPQHTWQGLQAAALHLAVVADHSDGGTLPARHRPGLIAELLYGAHDARHIGFGGIVTHYDQHR